MHLRRSRATFTFAGHKASSAVNAGSGDCALPLEATYYLTVAAIFKNEATAIREWCQHYFNEEADHILLIDNGSSDDFLSHIADYISAGKVTLLMDPTPHDQDNIYNRVLVPYLKTTTWLQITDMDEFVYGRNGSIVDYLKALQDDVGAIRLTWKMFGSSEHLAQPQSILQSFTQRAAWHGDNINVKSIFRSRAATHLQMHRTTILSSYQEIAPYLPPKPADTGSNEADLAEHVLHLNHYPIQSRDWFMKVKATRGDAASTLNVRDTAYFETMATALQGVLDEELCQKSKLLLGMHI